MGLAGLEITVRWDMSKMPDGANDRDWLWVEPPVTEVPVTFIPDPAGHTDPAETAEANRLMAEWDARWRKSQELFRRIRRDPVAYFSRQNQSARKQDGLEEMGALWTYFWGVRHSLEQKAFKDERAAHLWASRWPLPVGRASLRAEIQEIESRNQTGHFGDWSFLDPRLPFEGDELALAIIVAEVDGYRVEAFGLGVPDGESEYVYRPTSMKFTITGEGEIPDAAVRFTKNASAWWATQAGRPVGPGGAPFKGELNEEIAIDVWLDLYRSSGGFDPATRRDIPHQPPKTGEVIKRLQELGLRFSDSTFYSRKRTWTNYPPSPPDLPDEFLE